MDDAADRGFSVLRTPTSRSRELRRGESRKCESNPGGEMQLFIRFNGGAPWALEGGCRQGNLILATFLGVDLLRSRPGR